MAQDDYFYEIQLTNKQLVFYFMAGATGLILSFLAGVAVGRGVDGGTEPAPTRVAEERVVAEEAPRPAPSAEDLTYAQRLEGEKADDTLERPAGETSGTSPRVVPRPLAGESPRAAASSPEAARPTPTPRPAATVAAPTPRPVATPRPPPSPRTAAATPRASASPRVVVATPLPLTSVPATSATPNPAGGGNFTIQVGAFKDRASAESVVTRLKGKGFAAYVTSSQGDLFNVRVGNFAARAEAERVQGRLRDDEKFQPFIVRN